MILKDYKRAERLNEVYKHLFANFGIKSKKEMADYMKIQRTGLSAALNGAAANLTDNLFKKICLAWPGVFNLDYLLTGEGELLINGERKQKKCHPASKRQSIHRCRTIQEKPQHRLFGTAVRNVWRDICDDKQRVGRAIRRGMVTIPVDLSPQSRNYPAQDWRPHR